MLHEHSNKFEDITSILDYIAHVGTTNDLRGIFPPILKVTMCLRTFTGILQLQSLSDGTSDEDQTSVVRRQKKETRVNPMIQMVN